MTTHRPSSTDRTHALPFGMVGLLLLAAGCASQTDDRKAQQAPDKLVNAVPTQTAPAPHAPRPAAGAPAGGTVTDGAGDTHRVEPPKPAVPTPSVASLTPYFDTPELSQALGLYHGAKNARAAALFSAFATANPGDVRARPARLLALLSHHDAGVYAPTDRALVELAAEWPLMAEFCLYFAGSARHKSDRHETAIAALRQIDRSSTLWTRAQELIAAAHGAVGRDDKALEVLRTATQQAPTSRSQLWTALADLQKKRGDLKGLAATRFQLAVNFAKAGSGRGAFKRLELDELSEDQLFALGTATFNAQRHRDTLKILRRLKATSPHYCNAQVLIGRALSKQKKRTDAWKALSTAAACTGDAKGDATFAGGRNRLKTDDFPEAIRLFRTHVDEYGDRTTADDSLIYLAKAHRELGDTASADAALLEAVTKHPDGDMWHEAAWSLVWPRILERDYASALRWIDKVKVAPDSRVARRDEGRLFYWRARALAELDRHDEALAQLKDVIKHFPLTWYGVLAYSRLSADKPDSAEGYIQTVLKATTPGPDPFTAIPPALWSDPHFRRATEFARMGLIRPARREMKAVKRVTGFEAHAADWTKAALYQRARVPHLSVRLARRRGRLDTLQWPLEHELERWRISYPKAFASHVNKWATHYDIDPFWIWSVMRTESNFNPSAESWANAIGLMQIILPTAQNLARGTKHKPTRANLQKPAVAIELGAKYLDKLFARNPVLPLASAGYNAGGGSIKRWRREFGGEPLDRFVERIPYREARRYAKRVTETWSRYRYVWEGELATVPLGAPGKP